jgi:hypothetical protein
MNTNIVGPYLRKALAARELNSSARRLIETETENTRFFVKPNRYRGFNCKVFSVFSKQDQACLNNLLLECIVADYK